MSTAHQPDRWTTPALLVSLGRVAGRRTPVGPRTDLLRLVDAFDRLDATNRGYLLWLAELLVDWQQAYRDR